MTWEWSLLLSVLFLCASFATVLSLKFYYENHVPLKDEELSAKVFALEHEHAEVKRLAEETKKMLSQENLSKSLRGRQ